MELSMQRRRVFKGATRGTGVGPTNEHTSCGRTAGGWGEENGSGLRAGVGARPCPTFMRSYVGELESHGRYCEAPATCSSQKEHNDGNNSNDLH